MIDSLYTNIKRTNILRKWSYEKVYFFIMMIYLGMANGYTQVLCFPPSEGIVSFIVPFILTFILIYRNPHAFSNNKIFYKIIGLVLLWVFLQVIKYEHFNAMNMFLFYNFCLAYVIAKVYGKYAMNLYDKDLTILCIISLIVWLIYNVAPSPTTSFFQKFFMEEKGTATANAFLVGLASSKDILGYRNLGFGQEPGFFASFIILGMFFNLIINKYKVLNRNFIIQLITLITTQSTTGYASFLIIVLLIVANGKASRYITIALVAILLPTIIALPFVGDKIKDTQSNQSTIDNVVWNADYIEQNGREGVFVPQRFDGFALELMNFEHDPILGYGVKGEKTSYVSTNLSPLISCSNGNIKVFSRFGLIFGLFFFFVLYHSGLYLCDNNKKSGWIFLLMYLFLSMSYDISTIPLLLSFWFMLPFFKGTIKTSNKNSLANSL